MGDRKGQWSIRINDQWRICFTWRDGDAYDVEITDYHLNLQVQYELEVAEREAGERIAREVKPRAA